MSWGKRDTNAAKFMIFRSGSTSVSYTHLLLLGRGYTMENYGADGSFGPATKAAVTKYQQDKGILADGLAGKETFTKLLGL